MVVSEDDWTFRMHGSSVSATTDNQAKDHLEPI
jgi:hypothetical protein